MRIDVSMLPGAPSAARVSSEYQNKAASSSTKPRTSSRGSTCLELVPRAPEAGDERQDEEVQDGDEGEQLQREAEAFPRRLEVGARDLRQFARHQARLIDRSGVAWRSVEGRCVHEKCTSRPSGAAGAFTLRVTDPGSQGWHFCSQRGLRARRFAAEDGRPPKVAQAPPTRWHQHTRWRPLCVVAVSRCDGRNTASGIADRLRQYEDSTFAQRCLLPKP